MIKVRGKKVAFTGKDAQRLKREAKSIGLSEQEFFTGCLWESIMRHARNGVFLEKAKKSRN